MLLLLIFSFFATLELNCATENNVCSTFSDYFSINTSPNCWYDFSVSDKAPSVIVKHGYPYREYKVVTEDRYILTVFRIPSKNGGKGAVFLQHGIESSGKIFTSLGNESLAFLLADVGYDVWIGNYRGNEYSEEHEYLDVSMEMYWNHSFDDIALKDIPAMINLVKSNTPSKDKIVYIGHSLGTTLAMMYCAEHREHCKENIKHFFWLGPAYKLIHMKSPFRLFSSFVGVMKYVVNVLKLTPELSSGILRDVSHKVCLSTPVAMQLCHLFFNLFFGMRYEILPQTVPVMINEIVSGTTIIPALDSLEQFTKGEFRKYDYGSVKNMNVYGNKTPPDYDISTINVNVSLFYSTSDWATGDEDAKVLYNTLSENVRYGNHKIDRPNFNHMDILLGPSAKKLIFHEMLKELNSLD